MKGSRLALCLFISITANAYAAGDPVAGQEKSAVCQGCHGVDGNSYGPDWPNLASQGQAFIIKQLKAFQSGARKDPTMTDMAAGLSEQDMEDISAYFTKQEVKPQEAQDAKASSAGKKLFVAGNRYTGVPACSGCHGPNAVGNGPGAIPRLAGQKPTYVTKALKDFRSGTRTNDRNSIMQNIAEKMSDKDIEQVAAYLAGMVQ